MMSKVLIVYSNVFVTPDVYIRFFWTVFESTVDWSVVAVVIALTKKKTRCSWLCFYFFNAKQDCSQLKHVF